LLVVGGVLMLNTIGVLEWSIWWQLVRFWPVLLIAAGLDLLLARSALGGLLAALLVGALLVGTVMVANGSLLPGSFRGEALTTTEISQPLGSAERANISIRPGVGHLRLAALPESANLVEGTVQRSKGEELEQDLSVSGSTATFTLHTERTNWGPFDGHAMLEREWDLGLSPAPVIHLTADLGVGAHDLDLSGLSLGELAVDLGLGQTKVILPATGGFTGKLDCGLGNTEIVVPEGLGLRVRMDTGLTARNVPSDWERHGDDLYVSPDYDTAEYRAEISIDHALGAVTIRVGE
jgi:hypothetical protein